MRSPKKLRRDAKQLIRFCVFEGVLDEARVRQTVQKVLEVNRRGSLTLVSHFRRLVKLERARHTAEVESAMPLPVALQANIVSSLDRLYGPGLSTSFTLNPALIGGMRVQVGSDVYDGSVRSGLAALHKNF